MEIYYKLPIDIKYIIQKIYFELQQKEDNIIWLQNHKKKYNQLRDEYLSHIKQLDKYITHNNDCSFTWFSGFKGYFCINK